jgi:PAS domain-containing protein
MPEPPRHHNLVLILAKDLASRLATPVFVVDGEGTLLYFNEAAEVVLGTTYADAGGTKAEEWTKGFDPLDENGASIPLEELPIGVAVKDRRPSHRELTIRGGDGVRRDIAATAFPLFAHTDELVGAVAVFWERSG